MTQKQASKQAAQQANKQTDKLPPDFASCVTQQLRSARHKAEKPPVCQNVIS